MPKILISGYYGFENIGDESILRTLVASLREKMPDCELTVLSHCPKAAEEKYGLSAVDRIKPFGVFKAIKNCDMLISGGGSLLQDVTSGKSIIYYLSIIRLAKLLGKKVFIYSQGIGPITRPLNRRLTARILSKADGIVVRDEKSAQLVKEIGVSAKRIEISADPVIRMNKPENNTGRDILKKAGIGENSKLAGWAVREKNPDSRFVEEAVKSISWLKENKGIDSVLIPFHYDEDMAVCSLIAQKTGCACLSEKYLSEDMLSVIGNLDFLVGVRLHSLIYAAIMGTPVIGVSYDPKCDAFLESVGISSCLNIADFTSESFAEEYERLENTKEDQQNTVALSMEKLKDKLDINERMICDILSENKVKENKEVRTAGAISIVFILMLTSKLLGVVREMLQAKFYGTGIDADLYSASYNSTLYLFITVCYALCIAAVPILTKEFTVSREKGFKAADNLLCITLAASVITVIIWQIWPSTPLLGMLWDVSQTDSARLALYIRIMSLALPVVAAAYIMVALFQATDHPQLQGCMSIPYNIFFVAFMFLFGKKLGITGVVTACTCGWILQLAMSIPFALKERYKFRFTFDLKSGYIGTYFKTAAVSILTTSVFLFCYLSDTSAASNFSSGAVSSFYYADKLFTPVLTTFLYSISAVMFPKFNREYASDINSYKSYIWGVTENILLFIFPVCAVMSVFGTDIIRVIFESGSFTEESTAATGNIFAMYALGMSAFSVLDVLNKAYYAMKKTAVPLAVNLGIIVLNLVFNHFASVGTAVALTTSLAMTLGAVIMAAVFFAKSGAVSFNALIKGLLSVAVMTAVLYFGHNLIVSGVETKLLLVIKCVALGAASCIVYVAVSLILKQKILIDALKKLRHKA